VSDREPSKSIADRLPELSLQDFTYELPPELIAQQPAAERSSSRLLLLHRRSGTIEHRQFFDLPDYLRRGDALVLNNTRVIPSRIMASRTGGGLVEILLLKPEAASPGLWQAMASPLRKLKKGEQLKVKTEGGQEFFFLVAGFVDSLDSQRRVLLDFGGGRRRFMHS